MKLISIIFFLISFNTFSETVRVINTPYCTSDFGCPTTEVYNKDTVDEKINSLQSQINELNSQLKQKDDSLVKATKELGELKFDYENYKQALEEALK